MTALMERVILHLDMNSYFATVEQQAHPELRGRPVAVAQGRSGERRLAIAASVEAKARGVRTAMRYREAMELCPELIWVWADHHKYQEVSKSLLRILSDFSPELEIFSVDEAFLDLTRTRRQSDPVAAAKLIKSRIRAEVGEWITSSIGIAPNKFLAKLATDLFKPDALIRIRKGEERWLLQHAELEDFCGIGRRIHKRLELLGIRTVEDLAAADERIVKAKLGINGVRLVWAARGFDPSPLEVHSRRKDPQSMGHETTLPENVFDRAELSEILLRLSEQVGRRLRRGGFRGRAIHLRVRYADFSHDSRRIRLGTPTDDTYQIFAEIEKLFASVRYAPVRLLAVTAAELSRTEWHPLSLFPEERVAEQVKEAIDRVNDRYGEFTLTRGMIPAKSVEKQLMPKHFGNKRIEF
jgi:DNA polymerase IV